MEMTVINDKKYTEYESLLLERDQFQKEAGQAWTCYTQVFGQLISDVYEEKIECIKCKKTIACYQQAQNRGGVVDQAAVQEYLEREMASYYANLKRMLDDYERCKNAGTSTSYEVRRSRTLYRRLAKLIHPDINPETDRQEVLKELWVRILKAYGRSDIRELSELEVLVRKALKDLGAGEIRVDIPDIKERINALKDEIFEITHTEPYTYKTLLDDEEKVEKKKAELQDELDSYRKYHGELDGVIVRMINSGGIRIQWRMN